MSIYFPTHEGREGSSVGECPLAKVIVPFPSSKCAMTVLVANSDSVPETMNRHVRCPELKKPLNMSLFVCVIPSMSVELHEKCLSFRSHVSFLVTVGGII